MSSSTAQGQLRSGAANADLSRIEVAGVGQQIVHLDFDGATGVDFEGDFVVEDIDVPAFSLEAAGLPGLEPVVIALIHAELAADLLFIDVEFTLEQPKGMEPYSTIYIGGTDGAFREHGSFTSISEGFDEGNRDRSDVGFVFSDNVLDDGEDWQVVVSNLLDEIGVVLASIVGRSDSDGTDGNRVCFADLCQPYGEDGWEHWTLTAGPDEVSFEVDGVPTWRYTNWHVDGVFVEQDSWTGGVDPEYEQYFASGTTEIIATVYNYFTGNLVSTHEWNIEVGVEDLVIDWISLDGTKQVVGDNFGIRVNCCNVGNGNTLDDPYVQYYFVNNYVTDDVYSFGLDVEQCNEEDTLNNITAPTSPGDYDVYVRLYQYEDGPFEDDKILTTTWTAPNSSPSVSLSDSPDPVTQGSTLTLTASVSDPDGSGDISSVRFFVDGDYLGSDSSSPYRLTPTANWSIGPHVYTAMVIDNAGAYAEDTSPGTVVAGNSSPSITLSDSPDPVLTGGTLTLTASVSDPDGAGDIDRVKFYRGTPQDGTYLGEDTGSGGGWHWSGPVNWIAGEYTYWATVYDDAGATDTDETPGTVQNSNSQPSVALSDSPDPVVQGQTLTLTASVSDPDGDGDIDYVRFSREQDELGVDYTSPYQWSGTASWSLGTHTYTASVHDYGGASALDSVNGVVVEPGGNSPPSVTLSDSPDPVVQGETLVLTVVVSDPDGESDIDHVTFSRDDGVFLGNDYSSPYIWNGTASWSTGSHTYLARAVDEAGASGEDTTEGTVDAPGSNFPPSVDLTDSPDPVVEGAILTLTATVTDPDGAADISYVVFYIDGYILGNDSTSPYTWSGTVDWPPDTYTYKAKAWDYSGAAGEDSEEGTVVLGCLMSCSDSPDPVWIGEVLTLDVVIDGGDCTVDHVNFYRNEVYIGTDMTAPFGWSGAVSWSLGDHVYDIHAYLDDGTLLECELTNTVAGPPTGACCVNGTCQILTEAACEGQWYDDRECEQAPCGDYECHLGLDGDPFYVVQNEWLTLTATLPSSCSIDLVTFYRNDSTVLGEDHDSGGGWTWSGIVTWGAGPVPYKAVASLTTGGTVNAFWHGHTLASLGGCCVASGSCFDTTHEHCNAASGIWSEDQLCEYVDCDATGPDPPNPGACCINQTDCAVMGAEACENAGGVFLGDASCNNIVCGESHCCVDGACVIAEDQYGCTLQGGTWTTEQCILPEGCGGACCLGGGLCVQSLEPNCAMLGGQWTPNGTCDQIGCNGNGGGDPVPGDYNHDGCVDINDILVVADSWHIYLVSDLLVVLKQWTVPGDYNHDGCVDINDILVVANNWQTYDVSDLLVVLKQWTECP